MTEQLYSLSGYPKPPGVWGVDISKWQDAPGTLWEPDLQKLVDAGMKFCFVRASYGKNKDIDFDYNWHEAKRVGLLRGAYHYIDWYSSELDQARLFVDILRSDPGELPPVADYECKLNAPPREIAQGKLWNFVSYVEKELNITPMIYSGYFLWAELGNPGAGWERFPLWLPWYRPMFMGLPAKPKIPKPWNKYTFWQYDDKGDGLKLGMESKQIDLNVFNGSMEELLAFAKHAPEPHDNPTDEISDAAKLTILWKDYEERIKK